MSGFPLHPDSTSSLCQYTAIEKVLLQLAVEENCPSLTQAVMNPAPYLTEMQASMKSTLKKSYGMVFDPFTSQYVANPSPEQVYGQKHANAAKAIALEQLSAVAPLIPEPEVNELEVKETSLGNGTLKFIDKLLTGIETSIAPKSMTRDEKVTVGKPPKPRSVSVTSKMLQTDDPQTSRLHQTRTTQRTSSPSSRSHQSEPRIPEMKKDCSVESQSTSGNKPRLKVVSSNRDITVDNDKSLGLSDKDVSSKELSTDSFFEGTGITAEEAEPLDANMELSILDNLFCEEIRSSGVFNSSELKSVDVFDATKEEATAKAKKPRTRRKPRSKKSIASKPSISKNDPDGRYCETWGCTKLRQGPSRKCKRHGGGRRCATRLCTTAARGKTLYCIRHGGGERCEKPNCTHSAVTPTKFCIKHGGGRHCEIDKCKVSARSASRFCYSHKNAIRRKLGEHGESVYAKMTPSEKAEFTKKLNQL